jgi:hypothetical protein
MSDGDKLQTELSVLKKMTRFKQANLISLKRSIASVHIAAGKYVT